MEPLYYLSNSLISCYCVNSLLYLVLPLLYRKQLIMCCIIGSAQDVTNKEIDSIARTHAVTTGDSDGIP